MTTPAEVDSVDIKAWFFDFMKGSGVLDLIGGPETFQAALEEIEVGLIQIVGDVVAAEKRNISLHDAVFDTQNYPHLAVFHGIWIDFLSMEVPAELRPWVEKVIAAGPAPDAPVIRRWVVHLALKSRKIFHRNLARLILFEGLCFNEHCAGNARFRVRVRTNRRSPGYHHLRLRRSGSPSTQRYKS